MLVLKLSSRKILPCLVSRNKCLELSRVLCGCAKMASTYAGDPGNEVIVETFSDKAVITLNRPKALNSLNVNMVEILSSALKGWQSVDGLKMMIIKGIGGKAFCAGGDVKAVAGRNTTEAKKFFCLEYFVNHAIGTSKVPWIALIDGITMGGGAGLSVHGHFRVATEKTIFAMPETAIGLIPDVGGGHFLPRLPGGLGNYLATTGHRLRGRDVFSAGIATHFVQSNKIQDLEKDLLGLSSPSLEDIKEVLDLYHGKCAIEEERPYALSNVRHLIDGIFSSHDVEDILDQLKQEGSDWSIQQKEIIEKMSPTSLKVTLEQLKRGRHMSLKEVLQMEYRIVLRILEGEDFREGVRALLIDKDLSPKWKPSDIKRVTKEIVDGHFKQLPIDEELIL